MSTARLCEPAVTEIGNGSYVQRLITPCFTPKRCFCLLWLLGQAVTEWPLVRTREMPRGEVGVLSLDNLDKSVHHVRHTSTPVQKLPFKCGL